MNRIREGMGGRGLSPAQAWIKIQVKHYKMKRNNEASKTVNVKYTYKYKCKLNKFPLRWEKSNTGSLTIPWTDLLQMI